MKNLLTLLCITASAIMYATPPAIGGYNVYFGHLHNHTKYSDGTGTPANAYAYARDNGKLDFFSIADHDGQVSATEWADTKAQANAFNQDGVFTTFYGCEWSGGSGGHVAVIGCNDLPLRSFLPFFSDLKTWMATQEGVAFCNHPGRQDNAGVEFDYFGGTPSNKFVGMELWNKSDGFSIYYYNDGYFTGDNNKGYYDEALAKGWKMGASGAGDNHSGTWGTAEPNRMAILSNNLTRTDLMAAMVARRFYSTMDKNIALSFKINNQEMGSTLAAGTYSIQIQASDGDSETFKEVVLIDKNFAKAQTWTPNSTAVNINSTITTVDGDYFYVRVKQVDGNEAISSPIWFSNSIVAVTGVGVTPSSISIANGATTQLTATVLPANAGNKSVQWSSSNDLIAVVSSTGLVTAKGVGVATITATTADGAKTASSAVTVTSTVVTDTQAPTAPNGLIASDVLTDGLNISWTHSTDNVGVVGYDVYKGATKINATRLTANSLAVTGLTACTSYSFTVVAFDAAGLSATSTPLVVKSNCLPTAVIGASTLTGPASLSVTFNSTGSSDPDAGGSIAGYEWDFGDGSVIETTAAPVHIFANQGTYTVKLRVFDNNDGFSAPVTLLIDVLAGPPTTVIQAEDFSQKSTDGAAVLGSTTNTGWTGTGYFDNGKLLTSYGEWVTPSMTAGTYTLAVTYASSEDRAHTLTLNGVAAGSNPFLSTGGFSTWKDAVFTVTLKDGVNTIRLTNTILNGVNIDKLTLIGTITAIHNVSAQSNSQIIYPNPTKDNFFITNSHLYDQVIISDDLGREQINTNISSSSKVNISALKSNVYLVRLMKDGAVLHHQKIVKK